MNTAPAFQFYPADFLADENVALMSLAARGAYITLLCYCWREGSIPADMDKMGRLCGVDGSAMAQLWTELCLSFSSSHDRYVNPWLERARLRQIEHRKERQESGKKGAESRWEKAKSLNTEELRPDSSAIGSVIAELEREPMAIDGSSSASSSASSSSDSSTKTRARAKKPTRKKRPTTCSEEYLEELQKNPTYSHLNVKAQYHRCAEWCRVRNLGEPTPLRFIAWLNREPLPPKDAPAVADEWANKELAATVEDLPPAYRRIALDASTDEQKANVLANYNRRVRQARGSEATP